MSDSLPSGFTLVDQEQASQPRGGQASLASTEGPPPGFRMLSEEGSGSTNPSLYEVYNPEGKWIGRTSDPSLRREGETLKPAVLTADPHQPPADLAPLIQKKAAEYGVPLPVANFVGSTESGWRPDAVGPQTSHGKAQGMWQFMPATAANFGIDPHDIEQSTDAAMRYLRQLADKHQGDWESAVADYGSFSTGRGEDADSRVRQSFRDYLSGQTSTPRDIGRGVGLGLIKGAGTVLGFPSDLWQMIDKGYQYALTEGAAKLGLISEDDASEMRKPVGEDEQYHYGSQAITRHLLNLARSLGANVDEPSTVPGQYAETMASFVPAAATLGAGSVGDVPGAIARYGLLPGAVSETAGQMTKGTPAEPYARVAGALAPAIPIAAMGMLGQTIGTAPTQRALQGFSDTQLTDIQNLLDRSRAAGAPLTIPEAAAQVTGDATQLRQLQRVVEQSPKGAAVTGPFMAQRPQQTQALGQQAFQRIGPSSDPFEVAPRVQEAAGNVVGAADQARTAQVNQLYAAAATDQVPPNEMETFLRKIDQMISDDQTGIVSPHLARIRDALVREPAQSGTPAQRVATPTPTGGTIYRSVPATPSQPRVPVTDIQNLDTARKYFRDLIEQPPWALDAVPKSTNGRISSLMQELDNMMESHSPNFVAAKRLYQQISTQTVNPLIRSPTGQLSAAETYPRQSEILFNSNPLPGSERAIGNAVRSIARVDPAAAQSLVRLYLERTFNEATQANMSGPNQWGAGKFAAVVVGNPQQAKNLEAAIRALPSGDVRWNAFRRSLDIMEGMGKRFPVGSATEFNRMTNKELALGSPAGEALIRAGTPARWFTTVTDLYRRFVYGRNTDVLARIFTEGDVSDLRKIAQAGKGSIQGQAALVGVLAREGAATTPEEAEQQP